MAVFNTRSTTPSLSELTESEREIVNQLIMQEIQYQTNSSEFEAFMESAEFVALQEAGKFSKKTIVRFNKIDDLDRRTGAASLMLAKQSGDSLFKQLKAIRIKEKQLLIKIKKKNKNQAARLAKVSQKEFIKAPILKVKMADLSAPSAVNNK